MSHHDLTCLLSAILFAEMDANGYAIITAAVFLGLGQITQMILSYMREEAKVARDAAALLQTKTHLKQQDAALESIVKQTNGLMDKAVQSSHDAGRAIGMVEAMKEQQPVMAAAAAAVAAEKIEKATVVATELLRVAEEVAEKVAEKVAVEIAGVVAGAPSGVGQPTAGENAAAKVEIAAINPAAVQTIKQASGVPAKE